MSGVELYWHCLRCGAHEPIESTGETASEYELGDHEPCIDCGDGAAHVMTLKQAAAYEQGLALGLDRDRAWKRAKELTP